MKRVLVIDDDSQVRMLIRRMLERAGYLVTDAPDGEIGIELHRAEPADLIITDLLMPGKEGIETIVELRKDFPDVKIIVISGGALVEDHSFLSMAERLGAMRALPKPFKCADIQAVVRELIGTN